MRYFKARAQRAADEGDDEAELRCLVLARALCDDQDHELLYDQAVAAHERHELPQALALYERARALEWRDPRVHTNLAVVRQQLGMAPETASAMVPGHATASASGVNCASLGARRPSLWASGHDAPSPNTLSTTASMR